MHAILHTIAHVCAYVCQVFDILRLSGALGTAVLHVRITPGFAVCRWHTCIHMLLFSFTLIASIACVVGHRGVCALAAAPAAAACVPAHHTCARPKGAGSSIFV